MSDEIDQMMAALAGEAPPATAPAKRQSKTGSAAGVAEPETYASLEDLIKSMPPAQQADVFRIAHALNIRAGGADEFLYSILVGLGYHKTILQGTPDEIREAGKAAADQIIDAFTGGAASVMEGAKAAEALLAKVISKGSSEVQIAAQKGARVAIENADLTKILQEIEKAQEKASAKKWFAKAMTACSIACVVVAILSCAAGWFIKSALPPEIPAVYRMALEYQGQLTCGAIKDGFFACRDKNGGTGQVLFKTLSEPKS